MKTLIFETKEKAAAYGADTVEEILREKPEAVFCLAAGHTSIPFFDELAKRHTDFSRARFIGLDEWAGIGREQEGSCASFLEKHFFSRVKVNREHIRLFDGMVPDLEKECEEMEACLQDWGGMDYLLLGVGMNGHLALNEPGDGFDRKAHPVKLSQTTVQVAPKYFPSGMPPISGGITLGIGTLLQAEKIQLAIFGTHKRGITEQLLKTGESREDLPASALWLSPAAELLLDRDAAGESGQTA